MAKLIPDIRGPKLPEFQGDLKDIEFVSLLSPSQQNSSSENIPHSRVFQIKTGGKRYALKIVSSAKETKAYSVC